MRSLASAILVFAFAAAGCGGDDSETTGSSAETEGPPPAELVGRYAMTLKPGDVPPNPPPELTDQAEHWTLEISQDGAPDGGPGFTIINDALGQLESSSLGVSGDRVLLHNEECAVSSTPVESEYEWALSGDELRFTVVSNGCDDDVLLTLLTSEPWAKS